MNQELGTINQEHAPEARVFVYGTLRRGGSNNFRMESCRWIGPASVQGRLYQVAWYPGLVLDEMAGNVMGDLYEVPPEQLSALDEFEGGEYRRLRAMVQNADDQAVSAWLWEWTKGTEELRDIPDGDWLTIETDGPVY